MSEHMSYTSGPTAEEAAAAILNWVGQIDNVGHVEACMTRVRLVLKDPTCLQVPDSSSRPSWLLGFQEEGEEFQFVLGPGFSESVAQVMKTLFSAQRLDHTPVQSHLTSSKLFNIFSKVFVPLIPGFIAAGIFLGLSNLFQAPIFGKVLADTCPNFFKLLELLGKGFMQYLPLMVGISAARIFDANPALAAVVAGAMCHPALSQLSILGVVGEPGRGGILAILGMVALLAQCEKKLKSCVPTLYSLWVVPTFSCLFTGGVAILILQPICGTISSLLGQLVEWGLRQGGVLFGAVLAASFLPLVLTGLHSVLLPIHTALLEGPMGVNPLITILSMAGMAQVGAALYVMLTTQSARLKRIAFSGVFPGIMGVGEPLIFSVTLPLKRPFFAACLGAGVAGGFVAYWKLASHIAFGLSGVPLSLTIADHRILHFLLCLCLSAISGFIFAAGLGYTDEFIVSESDSGPA